MALDISNVVPDQTWISATGVRCFLLKEPLLDWLNLYGASRGFLRDDELPGYEQKLEFSRFIMSRGIAFEAAVTDRLRQLRPVCSIATDHDRISDPEAARETLEAMAGGTPIVHQAVLHDSDTRTFGAADFLIRSDILEELFPGTLAFGESATPAPVLGTPYHYVVVDAKFTTLHLSATGQVGNSGSSPAYKSQLFIYNRALGKLQGYAPTNAYLLGRGWEQTKRSVTTRVPNAFDRLGPVAMDVAQGLRADEAVEWVRRVRTEGAEWDVLPEPTIPELYPNASGEQDFPWHHAKSTIAHELDDLTLLWWVGVEKRDAAVREGITRWTDPRVSATALGINGDKTGATLQAIIDIHRDEAGSLVQPARVSAAEAEWRAVPAVEFFVDFETVSNLNDDMSRIPKQNGQPLIYMIGCGHVQDGMWAFRTFCTDRLTEAREAEIIDEWLEHMRTTARAAGVDEATIIHWSFAEPVNYQVAYDSARERHPEKGWPELRWFDLWDRVFRAQPVVVRGALNFGLKTVARALYGHGLIEASWGDTKVDGLGAMVGAWSCDEDAADLGCSIKDLDLMREIVEYNEVDCRVLMEILRHLRANH